LQADAHALKAISYRLSAIGKQARSRQQSAVNDQQQRKKGFAFGEALAAQDATLSDYR
jgi:hypothetical protein